MKKLVLTLFVFCIMFSFTALNAQNPTRHTFDENYLTIPYVQDFENYSYHAFPTGWTRFGSEPYVSTSDFAYSGTKSLYFAITSPMYAVLPPVNTDETPLSDLMLSFQMFSTYLESKMIIGVMTSPTDVNTFTPVDTFENTAPGVFELQIAPLNNYTGTGKYVALKMITNEQSLYIDDVTLDYMPGCAIPSDLTSSNETENTITLHWTENGEATAWEVAYDLVGFHPDSTVGTIIPVRADSLVVTDLFPSNTYAFYVRAVCPDNDYSPWSPVCRATTSCTYVHVPYVQGFNGIGEAGFAFPTCWTRLNPTMPRVFLAGGNPSDGMLSFMGSGEENIVAVLPPVNTEEIQLNQLQLSFDLLSLDTLTENVFYSGMAVGVMTDPNDFSTFVAIDTIVSTVYHTLETMHVSLADYVGEGQYVALSLVKVLDVQEYICAYIDNVVLHSLSSCPAPINLTANNIGTDVVTLVWNTLGDETDWEVAYGPRDFDPDDVEATVVPVSTDRFITIYELTTATAYDAYVRAICDEDNHSDWSEVYHFNTLPEVGIDNVVMSNSISLMPNPAESYIELNINSTVTVKEAAIYNAFGQMIQKVQLSDNHARINLDNYASGMYFVRVAGENAVATKKFIKK